jgi:hypothetical protein
MYVNNLVGGGQVSSSDQKSFASIPLIVQLTSRKDKEKEWVKSLNTMTPTHRGSGKQKGKKQERERERDRGGGGGD